MLGALLSFSPPSGPYHFPIDTYRDLAGTFGELRPNHFHSGIDIKTYGNIGIPVRAIQEGYVYRLRINPYGFGKAVYLRHPDGRFSVYAHLDRFHPRLAAHIRDIQQARQDYHIDHYLSSDELPVTAGEIIAYSGSSGSSTGPHLHFEIRDPQERILDPLAWYQEAIPDSKAPIVQAIAFEPLDAQARVRGEHRKWTVVPTGAPGNYTVPGPVLLRGRVGLEYQAYDLLDGAGNACGVNFARLYLDGQLIHDLAIERFAFDETRCVNLHMDYAHYQDQRVRLQRAYIEPGNTFSGYAKVPGGGVIHLRDDRPHNFSLVLRDVHGNTTTVSGQVQRDTAQRAFPDRPTYYSTPRARHEIRRHTLIIIADRATAAMRPGLFCTMQDGSSERLPPAYMQGSSMVFLLPLDRFNYPVEIRDSAGQYVLHPHLCDDIFPDRNNYVQMEELNLYFPFGAVFDHLHLPVSKSPGDPKTMYSDIFHVGDARVPVNQSFLVSFRTRRDRRHLVVAERSGSRWTYAGSTVGEDDNVYATVRSFGTYCLMADTLAPSIAPLSFQPGGYVAPGATQVSLRVSDAFSGIEYTEVRGTLDGVWVPFEYDYKRNSITWDLRDQRPAAGTYTLEVEVQDKAHNRAKAAYTLRF
ncbi:MAG: hypothetical protein OHK0039_45000 [Bacteroidia bacterium]